MSQEFNPTTRAHKGLVIATGISLLFWLLFSFVALRYMTGPQPSSNAQASAGSFLQ
jgi:hypothetical protein